MLGVVPATGEPVWTPVSSTIGAQARSERFHPLDLGVVALVPAAAIGSAFGAVSLGGVAVYPFKVLVPFLAIGFALGSRPTAYRTMQVTLATTLAFWAMLSTTWSVAGADGVREASIFVFVACLVYVTCSCLSTRRLDALLAGWSIAVFSTGLIAIWELTTASHLPSAFAETYSQEFVVLATFANPNNFGAFLALALFVCGIDVARRIRASRSPWMAIGALTSAAALLPLTGSRLALLAVLIGGLTASAMVVKSRAGPLIGFGSVAVASLAVGLALLASPALASKFSDLGGLADDQTSTGIRVGLIRHGVDLFLETGGIGVGAGGYEASPPPGLDAVNAHNLWIELLSQYGFVSVLLICAMMALALLVAHPVARPGGAQALLIGSVACYVIAATAASSYINDPIGWTFVATFLALGGARLGRAAGAA